MHIDDGYQKLKKDRQHLQRRDEINKQYFRLSCERIEFQQPETLPKRNKSRNRKQSVD